MTHKAVSDTPVTLFDEDQDMVLDVLCKDGFGLLLRGNSGNTAVDTGGWAQLFHAVHPQADAAPKAIAPEIVSFSDGYLAVHSAGSTVVTDVTDGSFSDDRSCSSTDWILKASAHATASGVVASGFVGNSDTVTTFGVNERTYRFYVGDEAQDFGLSSFDLQLEQHDDPSAILMTGQLGEDVTHGGTVGDVLLGASGNDQLYGGGDAGNDVLCGGGTETDRGSEPLSGGHVDYVVCVAGVVDQLRGGGGFDQASYLSAFNTFLQDDADYVRGRGDYEYVIHGGRGRDTLIGGIPSHRHNSEHTNDVFVFKCKSGRDGVEGFVDMGSDDSLAAVVLILDLHTSLNDLQGSLELGCVVPGYEPASHDLDIHSTCDLTPLLDHSKRVTSAAVHGGWTAHRARHRALAGTVHPSQTSALRLADVLHATLVRGATGDGKSTALNAAIIQWARRVAAAQADVSRSGSVHERSNDVDGDTNDNVAGLMAVLHSAMQAAKSHN